MPNSPSSSGAVGHQAVVSPGVPFAEAIQFLRDRLRVSEAEWRALVDAAEAAAGEISSAAAEAMRKDLLAAVLETVRSGGSAASFRAQYDAIVERYGWSAAGGDPGWHADLVFRMETANAVAAGRWEQIQRGKALRPYIRYLTVGDHRVRPEHRLWHGIVLPADHPFWLTHWPPNGFNCRCTVQSLNARDLSRYGFTLTPDTDVALDLPPDKGFAGNVGLAWEALR